METFEILAGGDFVNAVRALHLTSAQCTYHYHPNQGSYREDYQVWSLSEDDFKNICSIDDKCWKEEWGWWRHCTGSNLGDVNHEFVVNGEKILAWDGLDRRCFTDQCFGDCPDYRHGACDATDADRAQCFGERDYQDILSYLCQEIGASTEKNVCACTIDLARQNGMTLSELFKKYLR